MDKRNWPWKKKSSDKQAAANASEFCTIASEMDTAQVDKAKQDTNKKPKYVQISMESYTNLTGLEDQVKFYEEQLRSLDDEVKELTEKLSEANTEMTNKENLVKQHARVAEEAVSGWEKAEAEALALKNHLESVTLSKLTAEDRASHLDGALKECMRQIRSLKEEHERKLHDVILSKTKVFDKMKLDLESRLIHFDQELMRSAAENTALSRSLQERSNMLVQLSRENSRAEQEIELLKSDVGSREKEVNSLKYELHIARKEMEIRNEEKNMSVRSAELANKQRIEGSKKIAKLEAECQRLRGLVRKKLPGPAALAQMKLEVENLGRDYGESRSRTHSPQLNDFLLDNSQTYLKENELLTERMLAMEEETKMLKEALAKRNSDLQAYKSTYAQANVDKKSPTVFDNQVFPGVYSRKYGKSSSFTSMSENGNDDNLSCSGSWATGTISERSHAKKSENVNNHLDLMDDFLEMEKLAYSSNGSNRNIEFSDNTDGGNVVNNEIPLEVTISKDIRESTQPQSDPFVFVKLQSKIYTVLESLSNEKDIEKVVEDIRRVMRDVHDTMQQQANRALIISDSNTLAEGDMIVRTKEPISRELLQSAIARIYEFVMILVKETKTVSVGEELNKKLDKFSAKYVKAIDSDVDPIEIVLDLSRILKKASELHFNVSGFKDSEVETCNSDCIDKIALPENKPALKERYSNNCARFSDSASDPDVPNDGNLVPTSESTATSWKCSFSEFEKLKMDKDNLEDELARCVENFENTKSRLSETEQVLAELKSQLISAQKSNGLAETQLKCMAESYRTLETRADELTNEVNFLQKKVDCLDNELQQEKRFHKEALGRCKNMEEQLERNDCSAEADNGDNTCQEKGLAAAAEKLADCQETIFLIGKQLKSLRPETDILSSQNNNTKSPNLEHFVHEEEPNISLITNFQDTDLSSETHNTFHLHRAASESPMDPFNAAFIPSDSETNDLLRSPISSKYAKHRPTKSGLSSTSSIPSMEKHARGFSRFFSSKG